ncbi:MAG: hypothetical protein ACFFGZ_02705 [Candidatus Thorarchaeota archaeon]
MNLVKPYLHLRILTFLVCFLLIAQQSTVPLVEASGGKIIPVTEIKDLKSNNVTPAVTEALGESFYTINEELDWPRIYYDGPSVPASYSYFGSNGELYSSSDTLDRYPDNVDPDLVSPGSPVPIAGWSNYYAPRAVRVDSDAPGSLYVSQYQPTSLHYDYSLTFEAIEGGIAYPFLLDLDGPTILRIFVRDESATIMVAMSYSVYGEMPWTQYYSPVFGHSDLFFLSPRSGIHNITIYSDFSDNTLMTVTPLHWGDFSPEAIPINDSIAGTLTSPNAYIDSNDIINYKETQGAYAFFSADIIANHCYRVVVNLERRSLLVPGSYAAFEQLAGNTSWIAGNNYDSDGYTFMAQSDGTWIGVLMVYGDTVDYTIFFQEVSLPEGEPEEEEGPAILPLNTPTQITGSANKAFKFTLPGPSMVAFNYTGNSPGLYSIYHWPDAETQNYISSYLLTPRYGNLFDQYRQITSSSNDWLWLPAGDVDFRWGNSGTSMFEVFAIPIQNMLSATSQSGQLSSSSSTTLQINQSAYFALELPMSEYAIYDLAFNDSTRLNQTIFYEMGIYTRGYEDSISYSYFELGNYLDSSLGSWEGYWWGNGNYTVEFSPLNFWNVQKYVVLLRPLEAYNLTSYGYLDQQQSIYSGQLIVDFQLSSAGPLGSHAGLWTYIPYDSDGGYLIPQDTFVTPGGSVSYSVNDAITIDDEQIFGIPLQTTNGQLYNITAKLTGTYGSGYPNASFTSQLIVSSGNIGSAALWDLINPESGEYTLGSSLFLSNASFSALLIGLDRSNEGYYDYRSHYRNATLTITLEAIAAPALGFEIADLDYTYNSTPSTKEQKYKEADKSDDSPGFELPILLAALSSMALIIVQHRRRDQKK